MTTTGVMMNTLISIVATGVGILLGFFISKQMMRHQIKTARQQSEQVLREAQRDAEAKRREAMLEAKDGVFQARSEFEKETRERRGELMALEKRLMQREQGLDRKSGILDRKEADLNRREKDLLARERNAAYKEQQYDQLLREQRGELERVAGMTAEEAKKHLLQMMEQEAKFEAAKIIKQMEDEAKENAARKAQEIVVSAIQRFAYDYASEATVSVVQLPNEEMKGRIIGREGRNIRALESATGIDLIIDDTPEAVIISGFDPMRREIAKVALERLIVDGRIHPARIEEVVEKVKKDIERLMVEEAQKILFELSIQDMHSDMVKLLGRLKYRTSYGQNNLQHAREAAFLCGLMAQELGLDVRLARRAALLHDIGKALSHEEEGTHTAVGSDVARRYGESPKVVNAIAAHHGDVDFVCPEAVLVSVAEGLSASRPGARREVFESYIKRLQNLEQLAISFKGVEKAYAIRAGREIRIIVKHEEVSDAESAQISREVAKRIEQDLTYPGQIKVTVIRESRYVELAK
jgi:ribonuclease Y